LARGQSGTAQPLGIKLRQTKLLLIASTSVAVLGDINYLQPAYSLKPAARHYYSGSVVWLSDGAEVLATVSAMFHCAVGILDFIMPQHLWQAATAYQDGNSARLRSGLPGCVINCVTGLASASSKNSTG